MYPAYPPASGYPPGYPLPPGPGKPGKAGAWYHHIPGTAAGAAPPAKSKSDDERIATLTAHLPPYDGFLTPAYPDAQLKDRYQLVIRDYVIRHREPDAVVWRRLYVTLYKRGSTHLSYLNEAYAAVLEADITLPGKDRIREVFASTGNDVKTQVPRTFAIVSSLNVSNKPEDERWQKKRLNDYVAYCLTGDPSGWFTIDSRVPTGNAPVGPVPDKAALRKEVMEYVTTKEDIVDRADGLFVKEKGDLRSQDAASVVSRLIRETTSPLGARDVDRLLAWAQDKSKNANDKRGSSAAYAFDVDVKEVPEDIKNVPKGQFADWLNDDHRYATFVELHPLQQTAVMVAYSAGVAPDEESRKLRKMAFATPTHMGRELLLYVMNHTDFTEPLASMARLFERIEKVSADAVVKESKAAGTLDETTKRGRKVFNERFVQAYLEHAKLLIGLRLNTMATFMKLRASMGSKLVSHEQLSGLVKDLLLMLKEIGKDK